VRRIEALIAGVLSPAKADRMLRDAIACAQRLGFPVLERRCLLSLKQCLGPERRDTELEDRLGALSHLNGLADRVTTAMRA